MNLIVNAIDALDDLYLSRSRFASTVNCHLPVGNLEISCAENQITKNPTILITTQLTEKKQVLISIADNGVEIASKVRNKLFDPFLTTKPIGKGTGLGLSISYQIIVEKHHGKLWCDSTPEQGTEFFIEIPTA